EETAAASLLKGFLHDVDCHVGDLDVHLQTGDAIACARYLEVHVAVMIFGAGDIGEDGVVLAFDDQAHRNAAYVGPERDARIHQRDRSAAHGGLRAATVGFHNVAHHAHGIGEGFFARDQR